MNETNATPTFTIGQHVVNEDGISGIIENIEFVKGQFLYIIKIDEEFHPLRTMGRNGSDLTPYQKADGDKASGDYDYTLQTDLFGGDTDKATYDDILSMVATWDSEDWSYEVKLEADEIRIYATREDSDATTPSAYEPWIKITYDEYYLVVARKE